MPGTLHRLGLGLVVLLLALPVGAAEGSADARFPVQEIVPGVWALLQPPAQRFDDCNSVVIDLGEELLLVDTPSDRQHGRDILTWIRDTLNKPVRFLVNTHWHGDHTQGNDLVLAAFPRAAILGHDSLVREVPERAGAYILERIERWEKAIAAARERSTQSVDRDGGPLNDEQKQTLARDIEEAEQLVRDLKETRLLPPTLSYAAPVTLHGAAGPVELHPFRGHTQGDTVLFLPQQKVLITGDLLDDLPYGGHGYPREWIQALKTLGTWDFRWQIPGHGSVRDGKDHLRTVQALFQAIVDQVTTAVAQGLDLEATRQKVDLADFRRRLAGDDPVAIKAFDGFLPETIARAWAEARGELEGED